MVYEISMNQNGNDIVNTYSDVPSRASMLTRTVSSFLDKQIM